MKKSTWSQQQKISSLWILFLTTLILGTLTLHWHLGTKISKVTAPLAHASIDIKFQTASFHLALEELIQGNHDLTTDQAWRYLDNALWHVQAMLNGGSNEDGTYYPITTTATRVLLDQLQQHLLQLKELARRRLDGTETGSVSKKNSEFNILYYRVITGIDQIHLALNQEIQRQEHSYHLVGLGLGGIVIVLALLVWWVMHANEAHRKHSEQRNARLARIIDESVNEIFLFDAITWRFALVNASSCSSLQYDATELLTMTPLEIMPAFTRESFTRLLRPLLDKSRTFLQFETVQQRRDGSQYDANVKLQLMEDEENTLYVAFIQDVTQQKKALQSLMLHETAMHAAANTILITDAQGTIQWANPAFTASTGYSLEEAQGKTPRILKSDLQERTFYQHLWETILAGQVWRGVFINKCKDGRLVHEEATITPVRNDAGRIIHFIAVKQDVTMRVQAERELQEAKLKAESASQAKSDFLATMSHEIRTPLNVVLGILELLKVSEMTPTQQDQVQLALGSGKMLLYLINDILDYSKIEANLLELDAIPFNLHTLLEEIALSMAPLAHAKQVELTGFFPQESPLAVRGDPNRLLQIFTNLIGNAIKFTPPGGQVEFHGGPVRQNHETIEFLFEIRDTGIGIPVSEREHIFERFIQANTSSTRQHGGTGLGLAICQRLIHLMRGAIGVDDNPLASSGCIFHFTIQLQRAPQT
ncbi:MAG: PAS domain S-box protein, partial [Magnetococcales bacterium]|nr:PAS domain S-box protein [Magnetococcales bacterium]